MTSECFELLIAAVLVFFVGWGFYAAMSEIDSDEAAELDSSEEERKE